MESHITFLNSCKVIKQRKINKFPKARHIGKSYFLASCRAIAPIRAYISSDVFFFCTNENMAQDQIGWLPKFFFFPTFQIKSIYGKCHECAFTVAENKWRISRRASEKRQRLKCCDIKLPKNIKIINSKVIVLMIV